MKKVKSTKTSNSLYQSLYNLDNAYGVSGDETEVSAVLKHEMADLYDHFEEDALGNHFYVKNGIDKTLKMMISAHLDEIGFIVKYIDERGLVYVLPVGYHDDRMFINQDVNIHTLTGVIHGVTGSKPAHILSAEDKAKSIPLTEVGIDVGTLARDETLALGVQVGDYVNYRREGDLINNGKIYSGKAVDNRAGCAVMVEVMRRLKNKKVKPTIYAVGSVQEEVGIRGAGTAATKINPDVAISVDVTLACGAAGLDPKDIPIELGQGAAVKFYDWDPTSMVGSSVPRKMTSKLIELAEKNHIPYQREVLLYGGTDAWAISVSHTGVLTGGISIPQRYMHTAVGTVHLDDLEACVQLLLAYINDL